MRRELLVPQEGDIYVGLVNGAEIQILAVDEKYGECCYKDLKSGQAHLLGLGAFKHCLLKKKEVENA